MLAGEPPHTGATPQVIMMKIITDEASPVTKLRRSVPPHVDAAIAKALERLPADRFDTIGAFGNALADTGQTAARTARTAALRSAPAVGRSHALEFALAAVAVVATAAAAWGWLRPAVRVSDDQVAWRVSIVLPDSAAPDNGLSLSDDGSMLVYGGRGPRGRQLWVRRAGSPEATPIPGTEDGSYPVLSPNGRRIAFHQGNRLVVAPFEGGATIPIVDDLAFEDWAAWLDDNRLVVPSWSGLKQVSLSDAAVTSLDSAQWVSRVDSAAGEGGHGYPAPLANGRGVVFTVWSQKDWTANGSQIAVAALGGQPHAVLMPGLWARYAEPGYLIVTQGNGSIVAAPFDVRTLRLTGPPQTVVAGLPVGTYSSSGGFSVSRSTRLAFVAGDALERSDLVRVLRSGEATPLDTSWSGTFLGVALSPDGKRAAVSMRTLNADELRVRDLASGGTARIAIPGANPVAPSFSSDGMSIVFAGIGSAKHGVYRAALGASAAPALIFETEQHVLLDSPALSPDGQTLYYTAYSGASGDLHARRLDASQDTATLRVARERAYEGFPAVSPDGAWLAYLSSETGRLDLYARPTDEARADRWQVSRSGVARAVPRWSRDGRELYYLAKDSVMAARVAGGTTFTIAEHRSLFSAAPYRLSFDVYPDGSFLMIKPRPLAPGALELTMLEGWLGSLAR
jgi:serine/threonine-protein kinase